MEAVADAALTSMSLAVTDVILRLGAGRDDVACVALWDMAGAGRRGSPKPWVRASSRGEFRPPAAPGDSRSPWL